MHIQLERGHCGLSESVVGLALVHARVVPGHSRVRDAEPPLVLFTVGHLPLPPTPPDLGAGVAAGHGAAEGDGVAGAGGDQAVLGDGADLGADWKRKKDS